jgi:Uma2 family endonuclease
MSQTIPTRPSVIHLDGGLRIPAGVHVFEEFRRWSHSDQFPERGRIDYLQGDVKVDMSPEDLFTHGTAKAAIAASLYALIVEAGLGLVFIGRARVASPAAGLSVEPDVVVVLWESLAANRVRMVPESPPRPGRYVELEGAPDLVVEILSDSSAGKDREHLPRLYAQAGIPELWLTDARDEPPAFEICTLGNAGYIRLLPDAAGPNAWTSSPLFDRRFRIRRHQVVEPYYVYHQLEYEP